jgi:hypothetical protein
MRYSKPCAQVSMALGPACRWGCGELWLKLPGCAPAGSLRAFSATAGPHSRAEMQADQSETQLRGKA